MPRTETSPPEPERIHRAARLDDAFLAWRARRAVRRGMKPTAVSYTGYGSTEWVRVLGRVLYTHPERRDEASNRSRGWRSFTSIPVVSSPITVEIAGITHEVIADRGGVIDTVIPAKLPPGWQTIRLSAEGSEPAISDVYIVEPGTRFGVISDVDDTVMVTALPRPLVAAWNTFVLDEHARTPVPGMAVLLDRLSNMHGGCPVIYLSTGAWNVAPTLSRFLSRHLYPAGALLLTDWGPTHDRIFRSGRAHKRENLRRLAAEFPDITWILVGDDGQHDEELYSEFASERPDNVSAVAIRQLSAGEAVLAGGRSKHEQHDAGHTWVYAPDGAGLLSELNKVLPD
ncbi:App1 family protein [Paramicrobacterium agarici]|uniref:Phosphatidate phosphatase APP1 n=1 Tax=Paramicrobacterium agarici TaxID=630514 RepID=A0A2A9DX71_9MICO|nr:phosphatase domain-containing protein [Microbacterium agarici]PFG31193.1 phosphatidate phosphatase APP1 [Microbacterium agarici]TQO24295.1 phosphatidate phosphatase APP1 [Microbacterium agarici]